MDWFTGLQCYLKEAPAHTDEISPLFWYIHFTRFHMTSLGIPKMAHKARSHCMPLYGSQIIDLGHTAICHARHIGDPRRPVVCNVCSEGTTYMTALPAQHCAFGAFTPCNLIYQILQHVRGPTHEKGHTLDLVITKTDTALIWSRNLLTVNFTVEEKDLVLFTQLDQLRLSLGVNEYTFSESLKQASYTHLALQVFSDGRIGLFVNGSEFEGKPAYAKYPEPGKSEEMFTTVAALLLVICPLPVHLQSDPVEMSVWVEPRNGTCGYSGEEVLFWDGTSTKCANPCANGVYPEGLYPQHHIIDATTFPL
ncbi:hypothetical protein CAPTEDRAFT_215533, partial [Capitella teleta]